MKKYIITLEPNILDLSKYEVEVKCDIAYELEMADDEPIIIYFKDIIKEADTIEELCDEFIWIWNKEEYPYRTQRQYIRYSFGEVKREMIDQLNYGKNINLDYKVYGAIWTSRGLIYVAKLNDKGELELI